MIESNVMTAITISIPSIEEMNESFRTILSDDFQKSTYKEIFKKVTLAIGGGLPVVILPMNNNPEPPLHFFRARKDIQSGENIETIQPFTYPSSNRVSLGRANLAQYPVFYASDSMTTAIKEIRAEPGEIVYVGHWKIENTNRLNMCHFAYGTLLNGPFFHKVLKRFDYDQILAKNAGDQETINRMKHQLSLYCALFVHDNHWATSALSHSLIHTNEAVNFLLYPSVANDRQSVCFAFSPTIADSIMSMVKCYKIKYISSTTDSFNCNLHEVADCDQKSLKWRRSVPQDYIDLGIRTNN